MTNCDPATGIKIRKTDNGLKPGDHEAPQVNRPLTDAEIKQLIEKAQNGNS